VVIEIIAITTPPIAGPDISIEVPIIKPKSVKINDVIFLIIVVDGLRVGIFRIAQPIGAPKSEIKIMIVTNRARDSIREE
jgi:hypothetical protein